MSADLEQLEATLAELKAERNAVAVLTTKEGLVAKVGEYLQIARSHAAGSSRLALGGRASGVDLEAVLAEDLLDDEKLADRLVKRLESQGFGEVSDRQKVAKLKALDEKIAAVEASVLKARKAAAIAAVEREYSSVGEAASL